MKNFILTVFVTIVMSMFYSCSSPAPKEYKPIDFIVNGQDSVAQGHEIMNYWSFVADSTNPANKYSKIDSITKYGMGLSYKIPDSLVGKELVLSITCKGKETMQISSLLVVSIDGINGETKPFFYTFVKMSDFMGGKLNEWVTVSSEVIIDAPSNDNNNVTIKVYSYKPDGKGNLLIDDLAVSIKGIVNPDDEE